MCVWKNLVSYFAVTFFLFSPSLLCSLLFCSLKLTFLLLLISPLNEWRELLTLSPHLECSQNLFVSVLVKPSGSSLFLTLSFQDPVVSMIPRFSHHLYNQLLNAIICFIIIIIIVAAWFNCCKRKTFIVVQIWFTIVHNSKWSLSLVAWFYSDRAIALAPTFKWCEDTFFIRWLSLRPDTTRPQPGNSIFLCFLKKSMIL